MRYLGNKTKLLNWIYEHIKNIHNDSTHTLSFYDLFSGTGAVSEKIKQMCNVVSCDNLISSNIVTHMKLLNAIPEYTLLGGIDTVLQILNSKDNLHSQGDIFNLYSENGTSGRLYFSEENGKSIDYIRTTIFTWKDSNKINEKEYIYLMGCFIISIHKVANTTGVFGAHLKKLNSVSKKTLCLKKYPVIPSNFKHTAYHDDNRNILSKIKEDDIVYLDPPYNSRQYGSNYHLLETIVTNKDIIIKIKKNGQESVTGLTYNLPTSDMCSKRKIVNELEKYCSCSAKYIFLSYNDEGLLSKEEIEKIMNTYGTVTIHKKEYKRYCSNINNKIIYEYLFCLIK